MGSHQNETKPHHVMDLMEPRMTRDIDLVVAFYLKDAARITEVLGTGY